MPDLELSQHRTICLKDGDKSFSIRCRRVEDADWQQYFGAIKVSSQQIEDKRVTTVETQTAVLGLVHSVIVDATGYKVAGGRELRDLADWPTRLPLAHRLAVAGILTSGRLAVDASEEILAETERSVLDGCAWSAGEDGSMTVFNGLVHEFKVPTIAQYKRYEQLTSKSFVSGGRKGVTTYANSQQLLCKLYDELIVSVEGYTFDGFPLERMVDLIRDRMDSYHKVVAVDRLFNPQGSVTTL